MPNSLLRPISILILASLAALFDANAASPAAAAVDPARRVALVDERPAWANPSADLGSLPANFPIQHATIVLARSPESQRVFERFLASQQQPGSADYHRWLTPVEVGERFGVPASDIAAVAAWLASANLQVESISNGRTLITFSGSAAAVGEAFGARLHRYAVSGEERISVESDPSIPAALAPVIRAVSGLYTVELNPMHGSGAASLPALWADPRYSSGSTHYVFPADFAAIYDLGPAYAGGINGTGQTIGIIGRSRVDNTDIEYFQQLSGMAVRDPTVIVPPNGTDPGAPQTTETSSPSDDQLEATIDVARAASVAPGATIDLIVSGSNSSYNGIYIASQYAIDTNPVPAQILNLSFGACEDSGSARGVALWDALFSQAAAEGISVFVCSGDSGAAGCDKYFATPPASQVLSPNYICSSSYATCVGGTEFADSSKPSQYWSATNGSDHLSALGYIPEGGWNEPLGSGGAPRTASTGGGVSAYIPTPAWQSGIAPGYHGRYTPDVALSSSAHDGYFLCFAAAGNGCPGATLQHFEYVYGTSASAPGMAGIAALINQSAGGPQGNLNPALYRLSVTSPAAFHDVTVQSSGVATCDVNTPSMCNNSTPSPTGLTGGLAGYKVGPGYDLVTGLGSLDAANLLASWPTLSTPLSATATALASSTNSAELGTAVTLTAKVTANDATLPVGTVSFLDGGSPLGAATLDASGGATYSAAALAAGVHPITAAYSGDATHAASTSAAATVATTLPSSVPPVILPSGVVNAASYAASLAPGSLASLFGQNLADNVYQGSQVYGDGRFLPSVASISVSVNAMNAPLIYIGPTQINFQVPWETPVGQPVSVQVTRAGTPSNVEQIALAAAASPSVFLYSYLPNVAWVTGTVKQGCATSQCAVQAGGEYQLWANGLGPKNVAEQDGVGDGALTLDALSVIGGMSSCQLTIGGIAATLEYCGAAPGEIIDQVNFTYPAGIPPGAPVAAVLTVNGASGTFLLPPPAAAPAMD
jgi:uncharacterized protein (TIGR03437 family)